MLKVTVPDTELYDERTNEFISSKEQILILEHSLVSLSKWESKWKKPFLSKTEKTIEETIDYIRCMTITQNVKDEIYSDKIITDDIINQVTEYIDDEMTATTFPKDETKNKNRETVTAEIIYYWMIALNISKEYEKWHLNRLMALINVCNIKNSPPKKMSKREVMSRNARLNAERKKKMNSRG
jgi:hypothetical protein